MLFVFWPRNLCLCQGYDDGSITLFSLSFTHPQFTYNRSLHSVRQGWRCRCFPRGYLVHATVFNETMPFPFHCAAIVTVFQVTGCPGVCSWHCISSLIGVSIITPVYPSLDEHDFVPVSGNLNLFCFFTIALASFHVNCLVFPYKP